MPRDISGFVSNYMPNRHIYFETRPTHLHIHTFVLRSIDPRYQTLYAILYFCAGNPLYEIDFCV